MHVCVGVCQVSQGHGKGAANCGFLTETADTCVQKIMYINFLLLCCGFKKNTLKFIYFLE